MNAKRYLDLLMESSGRVFYHGTPSGVISDKAKGIHVGTLQAATEALEARIGIPAEGHWDGKREYCKTLLAGKKAIRSGKYGKYRESGFNSDAPEDDYYPADTKGKSAKYGDGSVIPMTVKPKIFKVGIVGKMTNTPGTPLSDMKANATIKAMLKKGTARNGYYYINDGEDSGSISAVVPSKAHLGILESASGEINKMDLMLGRGNA